MNATRPLRRGLAVSLASVVTLGLAGCTAGGDDGDSLSTDDGGEAAATVAAAIEETRASSGRFTTTLEERTPDGALTDEGLLRIDGEFAGGSRRTALSEGEQDGEEEPWLVSEWLVVGERRYTPAAALRSVLTVEGEWSDGTLAGPSGDVSALDGFEWIDTTDVSPGFEADSELDVDPMVAMRLTSILNDDPFEVLAVVQDVQEVGRSDVDGVALRHFTASLTFDDVYRLILAEDLVDAASTGYDDPITEYLASRTVVTADLYLDADGRLVRSEVRTSTEIEPQYRECEEFYDDAEAQLHVTTEFRDLGEDVELPGAPDPSVVMTAEQLAAAFPYEPVDLSDEVEESVTVETVDGPRDRDAVVNDLSKYGYVIGLVPDPWTSESDRSSFPNDHVSNATVAELDDEALVSAYASVDATLAGMPHTATSLGDLTRPELLWNVKVGMSNLGIDLSVADGLTDAQLGELIDGYVVDNGWIVDDGVWGELAPEVRERFDDGSEPGPEDLAGSGLEATDDAAEGCPT